MERKAAQRNGDQDLWIKKFWEDQLHLEHQGLASLGGPTVRKGSQHSGSCAGARCAGRPARWAQWGERLHSQGWVAAEVEVGCATHGAKKDSESRWFLKGAPRMLVVSFLASFTNNDGNKTCIACLPCSMLYIHCIISFHILSPFKDEEHKDKRDQVVCPRN